MKFKKKSSRQIFQIHRYGKTKNKKLTYGKIFVYYAICFYDYKYETGHLRKVLISKG